MTEYILKRSRRKTIGITVDRNGRVIIRAPLSCTQKQAAEFAERHRNWIERAREKMRAARSSAADPFTAEEIKELKKRGKKQIPMEVSEAAGEMGVHYNRIAVRMQKTLWGSCSSKGNLNFNCLLVLLPENVRRYVIVHELCHLRQMDHSPAFWRLVEKYQPSYKEDRKQLRSQGSVLLQRIPQE